MKFPVTPSFVVSFTRSAALALAFNMTYLHIALATEGGAGHYLPGGISTLIDLAPTKPGWVVEPMYLHYDGNASANKTIPIAGLVSAGLNVQSDAAILGGLYTFEQTVLSAHYSIGAYLPYVWMSAEAEVSSSLGTQRLRDTASGIGDMTLIPAMLAWKSGFWQFNALLPVYAPTGEYHVGQLANPGLSQKPPAKPEA